MSSLSARLPGGRHAHDSVYTWPTYRRRQTSPHLHFPLLQDLTISSSWGPGRRSGAAMLHANWDFVVPV